MVFRSLKTELWKAFHSRKFLAACLIGFAIQCINLIYNIWYVHYVSTGSPEGSDIRQVVNLFARWISAEGWSLGYNMLLILPFVVYLILDYVGSFSPMQYLLISSSNNRSGAVLAAMIAIIGLFSYFAGLVIFRKREVL